MSCAACDPTVAPSPTRKNEHHYGAQFGDLEHVVLKDGRQVYDVVEVEAPGRALRCCEPLTQCTCGSGEVAVYWDISGGFEVRRTSYRFTGTPIPQEGGA